MRQSVTRHSRSLLVGITRQRVRTNSLGTISHNWYDPLISMETTVDNVFHGICVPITRQLEEEDV